MLCKYKHTDRLSRDRRCLAFALLWKKDENKSYQNKGEFKDVRSGTAFIPEGFVMMFILEFENVVVTMKSCNSTKKRRWKW